MGKTIIIIITVLIIGFLFFFRGPDVGDVGSDVVDSLKGFEADSGDAMEEKEEMEMKDDAMKEDKDKEEGKDVQPETTGEPIEDSVPAEVGDISDWQTYVNGTDGYTVRIHPWWWYSRYGGSNFGDDSETISIVDFNKERLPEFYDGTIYPIRIITSTDSVDNIYKSSNSRSKITAAGMSATKITGDNVKGIPFQAIVFEHDDLTYALQYTEIRDYQDIFDTMVETFEFND